MQVVGTSTDASTSSLSSDELTCAYSATREGFDVMYRFYFPRCVRRLMWRHRFDKQTAEDITQFAFIRLSTQLAWLATRTGIVRPIIYWYLRRAVWWHVTHTEAQRFEYQARGTISSLDAPACGAGVGSLSASGEGATLGELLEDGAMRPDEQLELRERLSALGRRVAEFPPLYRPIVALAAQGYEYHEIAEELRARGQAITVGQVCACMYRARRWLQTDKPIKKWTRRDQLRPAA